MDNISAAAGHVCVRDSTDADVPAIQRIYGHHVLHGAASFEEEPPSIKEMALRRHDVLQRGLPYLVAERDGKVVGVTSSAGYGHTIGKWIAFGYLPADETSFSDYHIEAFTERVPARRIEGSAYDPERKKILA